VGSPIDHYANKLAFETDAWDLHTALAAGEPIILIDTRSPEAYAKAHIPGAINLPHRTMDAGAVESFDRNATVVTYCDGIGCNASTKGALNMTRLGFQVKELIGGLEWWRREGYPITGSDLQAAATPCGCG